MIKTKFYTYCICLLLGLGGWTNVLFAQGSNNVQISSINTQNFPFVFLNVEVSDENGPILDLDPSLFSVCENGAQQTGFFEVIPPNSQTGGGGGNRLADIVFIQDNSGSMSEEQAAIRNNLIDFVGKLENSGIDFSLGLVRYGQSARSGFPILENNGNLTDDAAFFRDVIFPRNRIDGSNEPGYEAILDAATGFNFRPGAQRIFVVITDETPNQSRVTSQQATDIAKNNSITVFALTDRSLNATFNQVTMETNGAIFDIFAPFDFILDAISVAVSNSYLVRYQSSQPMRNGQDRLVELKVNLPSGAQQDAVNYTPGAIPIINLGQATKALFEQAFDPGTPIEVETIVMDEAAPFVQNVQLFYQNEGDATFQQIAMAQDAGTDVWRATIPQGFANTPSVNFYIVASDGVTSVSSPTVAPDENPYQIAILPNVAPEIQHTPIETASINSDLSITANVTDNTQFVAAVTLFYRELGDIQFQETAMTNDGNGNYTGMIPAAVLTCSGTEYYIQATDDQGVSTTTGSLDDPLFVTGLTEECNDGPMPPMPPVDGDCMVAISTGVNSILVNNLDFRHNKVIIYDPSFTTIIAEITYEENFRGDKEFTNLPTGKYAVQVQSFTDQFAEIKCDFLEYVDVSDSPMPPVCPNVGASCDDGDATTINDTVQADCSCTGMSDNGTCNVMVTAGAGSIAVDNLTVRHNRIVIYDPSFTTVIMEVTFEDNVQGSQLFENIAAGDYAVKVQSFTENFADIRCDEIYNITVTESGSPGPGGNMNHICDQITVNGANGVITVTNLVADNIIFDLLNENYYAIYSCGHECGTEQTVKGLDAGQYFVRVKSYDEDWAFICETIIPYELMTGASSRANDVQGLLPENFKLFPNPAVEEALVNLRPLKGLPVQLTIYNQLGKVVYQRTVEKATQYPEIINLDGFENGIHLLQIQTPNKRLISKKLVISRLY